METGYDMQAHKLLAWLLNFLKIISNRFVVIRNTSKPIPFQHHLLGKLAIKLLLSLMVLMINECINEV